LEAKAYAVCKVRSNQTTPDLEKGYEPAPVPENERNVEEDLDWSFEEHESENTGKEFLPYYYEHDDLAAGARELPISPKAESVEHREILVQEAVSRALTLRATLARQRASYPWMRDEPVAKTTTGPVLSTVGMEHIIEGLAMNSARHARLETVYGPDFHEFWDYEMTIRGPKQFLANCKGHYEIREYHDPVTKGNKWQKYCVLCQRYMCITCGAFYRGQGTKCGKCRGPR
jgi:hypothetical protein